MAKEIKIKLPEVDEICPAEIRRHLFQSYREFLLALKKAIDYQIEKVDKLEETLAPKKKEIKRVDVE
ncbi:MAG: hypothetical protein H0Z28_08240 [Archaeoglobus sp.]|nr:hypothetical protein [Archaeoglobus sp.]